MKRWGTGAAQYGTAAPDSDLRATGPERRESPDISVLGVVLTDEAFAARSMPRREPDTPMPPRRAPVVPLLVSQSTSVRAGQSAAGPLSRFKRRVDLLLSETRDDQGEGAPTTETATAKDVIGSQAAAQLG